MEVTSVDYFSLDGVSCQTVGLYCDTPPVQIMARQRGQKYAVGQDEDIYVPDDSYNDISLAFSCYAFKPDDFDTSQIYAYLHGKTKLTYTRNDGYYYKIRSFTVNASERYDGSCIKYTITFTCKPFRYIDNEETVTVTGRDVVTNEGTRYCKPIYTITTSSQTGNGSISVNGQALTFTATQSKPIGNKKLIVDAERMIVYDDLERNRMMITSGFLPFMNVGNNVVALSGIATSVVIQMNERCY